METKHTAGPLNAYELSPISETSPERWRVGTPKHAIAKICLTGDSRVDAANAARMAATWNACEGMTDYQVRELPGKIAELQGYVQAQAELKCAAHNEAVELRAQNTTQLAELAAIADALGTRGGHSSVSHIAALRAENERLREALRGMLDMATDNRTHGQEIIVSCNALAIGGCDADPCAAMAQAAK